MAEARVKHYADMSRAEMVRRALADNRPEVIRLAMYYDRARKVLPEGHPVLVALERKLQLREKEGVDPTEYRLWLKAGKPYADEMEDGPAFNKWLMEKTSRGGGLDPFASSAARSAGADLAKAVDEFKSGKVMEVFRKPAELVGILGPKGAAKYLGGSTEEKKNTQRDYVWGKAKQYFGKDSLRAKADGDRVKFLLVVDEKTRHLFPDKQVGDTVVIYED